MMYDQKFLCQCYLPTPGMWRFASSCLLFSNTYIFKLTTVQLTMFCFSVFQMFVEFRLKSWLGIVSWLWRYKSSIAGSLSWLSEVEYVQMLYSSVCFIFSSPKCNNTSLVNLLSVFFSLVDLSLIHLYYRGLSQLNVFLPLVYTIKTPPKTCKVKCTLSQLFSCVERSTYDYCDCTHSKSAYLHTNSGQFVCLL